MEKEEVGVSISYLPKWDLGTASIVSNDNSAGSPQTSANSWELVVVTTTNIAIMTKNICVNIFKTKPNGQK